MSFVTVDFIALSLLVFSVCAFCVCFSFFIFAVTTHTHYNEEKEKKEKNCPSSLHNIPRCANIFVLRLFYLSWRRFLVNFVVNFAVYLFVGLFFTCLLCFFVLFCFYCRPVVFFQVSFGVCGLL